MLKTIDNDVDKSLLLERLTASASDHGFDLPPSLRVWLDGQLREHRIGNSENCDRDSASDFGVVQSSRPSSLFQMIFGKWESPKEPTPLVSRPCDVSESHFTAASSSPISCSAFVSCDLSSGTVREFHVFSLSFMPLDQVSGSLTVTSYVLLFEIDASSSNHIRSNMCVEINEIDSVSLNTSNFDQLLLLL